MTTIEGNKLIAEFMGLPCPPIYADTPYDNIGYGYVDAKELCYHSSWDWLMPVYEKIVNDELYGENEEAIILFNIMYERLGDADGIEEVWKYIVKFIQWYNQNNNQ